LPYALRIADEGLVPAVRGSVHLARGVNTFGGKCTCEPVAVAHGLEFTALEKAL
jgi:alanine dehydrogenase